VTVEEHLFGSFPIDVLASIPLFPVHPYMMFVTTHAKNVVLPDVGSCTVLLLYACFLAMQHSFQWHIHYDSQSFHDMVGGGLLMRGTQGSPVDFGSIKVEDERYSFAV
jgi:uncharacterized membrane protein